jgi:putative membrane protein
MTSEAWNRIYCGPPPLPPDLWARWNLDPMLLLVLAGLAFVLRKSGTGLLGVAVLAFAFVSPLCALSAALFSARVLHHVLVVAVAAPLFAMAWPRHRTGPKALPFLGSVVVLWAWHFPAAYDVALGHVAIYWVMQVTLLGSAMLFWQSVLNARQNGFALLLVVAGWMQMAMLGALLTFAPEPLYATHITAPLAWGFTQLQDQQLGGLIMWIPAGIPYLVIGAWIAGRDWRGLERRPA